MLLTRRSWRPRLRLTRDRRDCELLLGMHELVDPHLSDFACVRERGHAVARSAIADRPLAGELRWPRLAAAGELVRARANVDQPSGEWGRGLDVGAEV